MRRIRNSVLSILAALLLVLLTLPAAQTAAAAGNGAPLGHPVLALDDDEGGDEMDEDDGADEDDSADDEEMADENEGADESAADEEMAEEASADEEMSEESAEYEEAYFEESYTEESETYGEAWSASVEVTEVGNTEYNYAIVLPVGGAYHTEAEMGIEADLMDYPFIWTNEGGPLVFDMIMLGVLDNGGAIDAEAFKKLEADEHASLLTDFPTRMVQPEAHNLGQHKWLFSTYRTKDGADELAKFTTHVGSKYYSFFFFGPAKVPDAKLSWAQMAEIVSSFDLK